MKVKSKLFYCFLGIITIVVGGAFVRWGSPAGIVASVKNSLSDSIQVNEPRIGSAVRSPLLIRGQARGTWFFEGSFPVYIYDGAGHELGLGVARAVGEWMTDQFVPFEASIAFRDSLTHSGEVILKKNNPSGRAAHDTQVRLPIKFTSPAPSTPLPLCKATGCSGQVCADHDVITTCEYTAEYACYKKAKCERQHNRECAWTQDGILTECLAKTRTAAPNPQHKNIY